MKALIFNIFLEEPLLATQINSEEPNSNISHSFIPGSTIRGALVGAYLNNNNSGALIDDEVGYQLFLSGKVRYLNGYLFWEKRLLPKPLSWFVQKGDEGDVHIDICDFAIADSDNIDRPKSPSGAYVNFSSGSEWFASPKRRVQVHNASTTPGMKQAGSSQVYRYDALAADQTFQAIIVADDDVDLKPLKKLIDKNQFVMGGATTGGYGLVKIVRAKEESKWQEYSEETANDEYDYITCLSDVILRNDAGQSSTDLGTALGIGDCAACFKKEKVVGGFNQKWGLPLPQSLAIEAGSVFKFPKIVNARQKLKPFLDMGVGERTTEGYGRIALNLHTKAIRNRITSPRVVSGFDSLSADSTAIAQKMADRYLRRVLENNLQEVVQTHSSFRGALPSSTQLSRVRVASRHALAQQDLSIIVNHMDSLKGAKPDWDKAKVGQERLFTWIKNQARLDQAEFLQMFKLGAELPEIAEQTSELSDAMEIEFRARLIDGVLKQAVNEKQTPPKHKRGVS